jgi:hypothetical protein
MRSNSRSAAVKGAARSSSAICWLRSFSSALANAAALAAPACCLRAVLSFSTTEPQSIVAAARRLRSACFLSTLSIALAHALWAAGCPFRRPTFVVLRGMALNSAFRRRVGANVHQSHRSAARQTLHSCPRHPLLTEPAGGQKCAHSSYPRSRWKTALSRRAISGYAYNSRRGGSCREP